MIRCLCLLLWLSMGAIACPASASSEPDAAAVFPPDVTTYFDVKQRLEQNYQAKIQQVVNAFTGVPQARVQVTLAIDYSTSIHGIKTASLKQPNILRDSESLLAVMADPASISLPIGKLKRINLSVILPASRHQAIKVDELKQVIGDAVGLDHNRGDRISVIWDQPRIDVAQRLSLYEGFLQHLLMSLGILCGGLLILWLLFKWPSFRRSWGVQQRSDTSQHLAETLGFLQNYPSNMIARALADEHPQVIASLLAVLPELEASRILAYLDEGLQNECVKRMSNTTSVHPEALTQIAAALQATLTTWQLRQLQTKPKR